MSIPASSEAALRDYLINHDEHYRDLVNEHRKYEARLSELASLHYPNEEEQLEETILKKKKLLLKDQMQAIASKYKTSATSH
jgi:uncharacterized protein YdcH (DUF465 family)